MLEDKRMKEVVEIERRILFKKQMTMGHSSKKSVVLLAQSQTRVNERSKSREMATRKEQKGKVEGHLLINKQRPISGNSS